MTVFIAKKDEIYNIHRTKKDKYLDMVPFH